MDYPMPLLRVSRHRDRQVDDRHTIRSILAEAMIAHVGFIREGWPVVFPFHYGLCDFDDGKGEQMVVHGSTGGRAFLDAAASPDGIPVSLCVSLNDGLVLGRTVCGTGAHFRSVVGYGHAKRVPVDRQPAALDALMDHIIPGRRLEVRPVNAKENAMTAMLSIPLDHVSAKVAGTYMGEMPDDGEDRSVWAGVVPLKVSAGEPLASPETAHPEEVPDSVRAFVRRWST